MTALFLSPLYILVNLYVVRWMIRWMGACNYLFQSFVFRASFIGIYIILATALLTGFLIKKPDWLHRFLKHMGNYFLGTFLYILLTVFLVDLGRVLLKYVFHVSWIGYRISFIITGLVCTMVITFLSVYGVFHSWELRTTPYDISIDKEIEGMSSLKLVLVADTHFGYNAGPVHARKLVKKINEQHPDLVCFAGDIFDNEYDSLYHPKEVSAALKSIQSKYGVYACWGNHDLNEPVLAGFTFKNPSQKLTDSRMDDFLRESHIRLLNDETVLIDNKFYLVGRKDLSRTEKLKDTRLTPEKLTENLDKKKPILVMDHQPKELKALAKAGIDLDLCGHTHDGQMFPGNFLLHLLWKNSCGYKRIYRMHNIVTSGAGIWGPNMRVGTNSEICSVTVHFD